MHIHHSHISECRSISFDITRAHVKALIYYNREEMQMMPKELAADKENGQSATTAQNPRTTPARTTPAVQRPSSPRQPPHVEPKKQAQKQAPAAKPSKVDRNALSACGSSVTLSEAALAAQARADATKEPATKRQRRGAALSETPLTLDDVSDEEFKQLDAVAERNNFATPTTPDEAAIFLRAIMGLSLCVENGEIVGYNIIDGRNYGGSDEPLPPGARAAFILANDGWTTVPPPKGKRGRGS